MVFNCSSCDYTTKQAGNLKRHINRKNSTCLQAAAPAPEAAAPAPAPTPAPARGGGRRKKVVTTTPVAEPPNDAPVTTNVFVNGSDDITLTKSYWNCPTGKLITKEITDNYDTLLSTLCDSITDEEGLRNLIDIKNFLENWRKQKDDHNKRVVLECLHDFHSLTMLMGKEIMMQQNSAEKTSSS